jgi:hypothetical protein
MIENDQNEPWCDLLAEATAPDHIVQLYQDEKFLQSRRLPLRGFRSGSR